MIRLIPQTQGRFGGFSVLSHLLSPKVKSTLLSIYDLYSALCASVMNVTEILESLFRISLMCVLSIQFGFNSSCSHTLSKTMASSVSMYSRNSQVLIVYSVRIQQVSPPGGLWRLHPRVPRLFSTKMGSFKIINSLLCTRVIPCNTYFFVVVMFGKSRKDIFIILNEKR